MQSRIQKIYQDLFAFMSIMRRGGTTYLIKEIAKDKDVWVLVPDERSGREFGDKAITFGTMMKMEGHRPKPILADNHTLINLAELGVNELNSLNWTIATQNNTIDSLNQSIRALESKLRRKQRIFVLRKISFIVNLHVTAYSFFVIGRLTYAHKIGEPATIIQWSIVVFIAILSVFFLYRNVDAK